MAEKPRMTHMPMPEPADMSNYEYGREWEKWVAKYFLARFGGHYDLAPGSRGAADVINFTPKLIICSQVKASRSGSDAHPSAGYDEQARLQKKAENLARARKIPAVALLALAKGRQIRFKRVALFRPSESGKDSKLKTPIART